MSKILLTSGFKWIGPKEVDLKKCTCNSSKGFVLEVEAQYPKELRKLNNDYPLDPDKSKIKMLSNQISTDLYNILIGNVKKLMSNFFLIKKSICLIMTTCN